MGAVLHHLSQRRRLHVKKEKFPSNDKTKAMFDKVLLVLAGMWPIANLPQALQVHIAQDVSGLSLLSWSAYVFFTIPWIIYGFLHKDKLIQFAYIANLILYSSVVAGILMYS